jgi:endoglucanase
MPLGVNLAGGEFGRGLVYGTNYIYPNTNEIDYYAAKGMDLIRVPFKISRVMPTKTGDLNPTEVARLKAIVDYAETKGITTVLDAHDYGAAWGSAIGTGTTTNAEFARFWGKMAVAFKTDDVYFGLMNEPNSQNASTWAVSNNAAIAAIREAGATQKILVPGTYWTGAHAWVSSDNDTAIGLGTVDPLNNYAFEVHQYLDGNSSGTSGTAVSATIGSQRLKAVTDWARANNKDLFLGEFGAANNPTALAALDDMTNFMDDNTDVWIGATYWAGGPWWKPDYHFLIEPVDIKTAGVNATDRPQMDVLEKYDLEPGTTVPPVDPNPPVDPEPPVDPLPPIEPEPPAIPFLSRAWPGRHNYGGDHDWLL